LRYEVWRNPSIAIQNFIIQKEKIMNSHTKSVEAAAIVSTVSDAEILTEYVRRFTIKAGEHISDAKTAANYFRCFFSDAAKKEKFVVCFLNGQHQVLTTEVMFVGSLTTSAVYPREVIARAIELGAAAVIFAHNHPSGCISPSSSDRAVTKKLQTALNALDISTLDHIIVGGNEHLSFADNHLL
jgi:DNA repair protein RadC